MSNPILQDRSCLVIVVPLLASDAESEKAVACLNADERQRASRFVTSELTRRFSICRGRLRMILSALLSMPHSELEFKYGSQGKPSLVSAEDLQFNISHSQDWALMAFARKASVGVDLEFLDRRMDANAVASQLLSRSELAAWQALPQTSQVDSLLAIWVAKEAILKALGIGIAESLRKLILPIPIEHRVFSPSIPPNLLAASKTRFPLDETEDLNPKSWLLHALDAFPNAKAALCVEDTIDSVELTRWQDVFGLQ